MVPSVKTPAPRDAGLRGVILDALASGAGLDAPPEAPWDRFARSFADVLREGSASMGVRGAVGAAVAAARAEAPLAPSEAQEAWARACALCAAREIARRAMRDGTDTPVRAAALDYAVGLVAACDQALPFPAELPTPASYLGRMIAAARASAAVARVRAGSARPRDGFAQAACDELDAQLPRALDRESAARGAARYALARADEALRRRGLTAPADPAERAARARTALIECAASLVSAVPREERAPPQAAWAYLWLARRACRISLSAGEGATDGTALRDEPSSHPAEATVKEPESTLLKTLEIDATDAAWRTAGNQFVKLAREPLVALLSRHLAPGDDSFRARVATFLDTDVGAALLASVLSLGLGSLPGAAGEVPQRLARELRVRAMADAGDLVAEVLMEPLRQVAATYLRDVASAGVARRVDPAVLAEGAPAAAPAFVAAPHAASGISTDRVAG